MPSVPLYHNIECMRDTVPLTHSIKQERGVMTMSPASIAGYSAITGRKFMLFSELQAADILDYRNVGLFRYWTVSNIPLFLLAAPTMFILCRSSIWAWRGGADSLKDGIRNTPRWSDSVSELDGLRRLAVPQALLAVMALLNYHVQIITRLSSAYPVWYLWIFSSIRHPKRWGKMDPYLVQPKLIVRWMVIYAMVQAALFASFLPPA